MLLILLIITVCPSSGGEAVSGLIVLVYLYAAELFIYG